MVGEKRMDSSNMSAERSDVQNAETCHLNVDVCSLFTAA